MIRILALSLALTLSPAVAKDIGKAPPPIRRAFPVPQPPAARFASSPFLDTLGAWATDDLAAAIALAGSQPDMIDEVGKQCWGAMMTAAQVIKAHPLPLTLRLATDLEAGRLVAMSVKKVCTNPQCTQMWQDLKNQINAIAPIPLPFSMADICAKVP